MGLENNLKYAREAILHCKTIFLYGAANVPNAKPESLQVVALRTEVDTIVHRDYGQSTYPQILTIFENARITNQVAKKYKCGNCQEQTNVAFLYLHDEKKLRKIDLLRVEGGDHCFLVIGRADGSNINDFTTWGENAVICDPWGERYYPAKELNFHLNEILVNNKYPPFDPRTQTVRSMDGNPRERIESKTIFSQKCPAMHRNDRKLIAKSFQNETDDSWLDGTLNEYIIINSQRKTDPKLSLQDENLVTHQYQQYISSQNVPEKALQYQEIHKATTHSSVLGWMGMFSFSSSLLKSNLRKKYAPALVGGAILSSGLGYLSSRLGTYFKNKSDQLLEPSRNIWRIRIVNNNSSVEEAKVKFTGI